MKIVIVKLVKLEALVINDQFDFEPYFSIAFCFTLNVRFCSNIVQFCLPINGKTMSTNCKADLCSVIFNARPPKGGGVEDPFKILFAITF